MKSRDALTKNTVAVLIATGAVEHSSYNFRNISKQLGNTDFYRVSKFIDILDNWRRTIRDVIETELRANNFIT